MIRGGDMTHTGVRHGHGGGMVRAGDGADLHGRGAGVVIITAGIIPDGRPVAHIMPQLATHLTVAQAHTVAEQPGVMDLPVTVHRPPEA